MTKEEFAALLDGREYLKEITVYEVQKAKEFGLVVVIGYSDDCCEFHGAINEEIGCIDGRTFVHKRLGKPITAIWCESGKDCSWSYNTEIPHAEFKIYEDGELYCIGMVIDLKDIDLQIVHVELECVKKALLNEGFKEADVCRVLEKIPTAKVKHVVKSGWTASGICQNCQQQGNELTDFCPNCGADMRKDK